MTETIVRTDAASFSIGRRGENAARRIVFPLREWIRDYGEDGQAVLVIRRPGDETPYVAELSRLGSTAVWTPTDADTAKEGYGRAELRFLVGDTLVKSRTYAVYTEPSLPGTVGQAPEPYGDWVSTLTELRTQTEDNAAAALADRTVCDSCAQSARTSASSAASAAVSAAADLGEVRELAGRAGLASAAAELCADGAAQDAQTASAASAAAQDARTRAEAAAEKLEGFEELAEGLAAEDGYYAEMTVGAAENLLGRGDPVTAAFTFRAAGGEQDIEDGVVRITAVRGRSLLSNGTISGFTCTGIRSVGFNAFDPEAGTAQILGGMEYVISGPYTALLHETDGQIFPEDGVFICETDGTLTVTGGTEGTCIHLRHSGYRDGDTEEYWSQTRAIPAGQYFPNGMFSAGTVCDELSADRAVRRTGKIRLGDATLVGRSTQYADSFVWSIGQMPRRFGETPHLTISDSSYVPASAGTFLRYPKSATYRNHNTSAGLMLHNEAWAGMTVEEVAAETADMEIVFELREPAVTEIGPPLNLTYRVSDFGTEEMTDANGPCDLSVIYGMNAPDTIRRLPKQYLSRSSLENLCTALGTALGRTVTPVWNADTASYQFTVEEVTE